MRCIFVQRYTLSMIQKVAPRFFFKLALRGKMKFSLRIASTIGFLVALVPSAVGIAQDFAIFKKVALERITNKVSVPVVDKNAEIALVNSLVKILQSKPDEALEALEKLTAENPNFRLAQLIKGDMLLARSQQISTLGNTNKANHLVLEDMRQEAKVRLKRYLNSPPTNLIPQQILQMSSDQAYAFFIDTSQSRLYVYQNKNGMPHYLTDYYISLGKNGTAKMREGDQKTPIGVYQVIANLPKEKLSDFYGSGAFPISYPNEWDQRHGRKGHGIWLHGTPSDTFSRPPRSSNGCVVLSNRDLVDVSRYIKIGVTPVVIGTDISWITPETWRTQKNEILGAVERWRHDWESRNINRYLSHYSRYFASEGKDLPAWINQQRTTQSGKSSVLVELSNISVYAYPSVKNMYVVLFDQDYRSNNLASKAKRRQYWLKEDNRWQILYEGNADVAPSTTTLTAQR